MDLKPMKNNSRFGVHTRSNSSGAMTPKKKSGKLDDVRSNGWLDAMKGSSPPRKITNNTNNGSDDIHYRAWMNNYPSALDSFEQIRSRVKDRKIVVFLDYDGTLSPIVDDPDRAFLSADMRAAVKNIAKYYPTAIISGRNRDAVFKLVGLTELYYAGSHGMDIMFRKTDTMSNNNSDCIRSTDQQGEELSFFQPARKFLPMIGEVYKLLVESTNDIKGAKVEDHKFCVSVHYRNVDEDLWPMIAKCVHDVLENYPLLKLTYGRKVFEVRPQIDWNKGKAVEFLLESLGFKNSEEVFPIYIGDDRTDEDAFKVLRDANLGFGILVSAIPKESNAAFSLGDTSEVQQFLEALVRMQEEEPLESIKGA